MSAYFSFTTGSFGFTGVQQVHTTYAHITDKNVTTVNPAQSIIKYL